MPLSALSEPARRAVSLLAHHCRTVGRSLALTEFQRMTGCDDAGLNGMCSELSVLGYIQIVDHPPHPLPGCRGPLEHGSRELAAVVAWHNTVQRLVDILPPVLTDSPIHAPSPPSTLSGRIPPAFAPTGPEPPADRIETAALDIAERLANGKKAEDGDMVLRYSVAVAKTTADPTVVSFLTENDYRWAARRLVEYELAAVVDRSPGVMRCLSALQAAVDAGRRPTKDANGHYPPDIDTPRAPVPHLKAGEPLFARWRARTVFTEGAPGSKSPIILTAPAAPLPSPPLSPAVPAASGTTRGKGGEPAGNPPPRPRLTKEQREKLIGEALEKRMAPAGRNAEKRRALAATVTVDDIEADTGIARSTVGDSDAWKKFHAKRSNGTAKKPTLKAHRLLTPKILAARPDPSARTPDDELADREDVEVRYRAACSPAELARFDAMTPAERSQALALLAEQLDDDSA